MVKYIFIVVAVSLILMLNINLVSASPWTEFKQWLKDFLEISEENASIIASHIYDRNLNIYPSFKTDYQITKTGYEKYVFYNEQAYKLNGRIYLEADVNTTVVAFLKSAYTNPTQEKCQIVQNYLSNDGITPPSCAELYTILQDRIVNGFKRIQNGIEEGRIDVNGNHIMASFDAQDFQIGKIGDNSVTIILQSSTGNLQVNATIEPNLATHINVTTSAPYNNLVAYWAFDKDTTTTAYDWTPNNHDGTFVGNAKMNTTTQLYGNTASFDGVGDWITVPDSNMAIAGAYTICVWFKKNIGNAVWLNRRQVASPNDLNYWVGVETGKLKFYRTKADTTLSILAGGTTIPNGIWLHACYVYDGTNMLIYLNGTSDATPLASAGNYPRADAHLVRIGNDSVYDYQSNANIDELMLFNTGLSQAQVQAIYNNQSSKFYPNAQVTYPSTNIALTNEDTINISIQDYITPSNSYAQLRLGEWFYNSSTASVRNYLNENSSAYANFDGVNDYVSVASSTSLNTTNNLTVAFWAKVGMKSTQNRFIMKGNTGFTHLFTQAASDTSLTFAVVSTEPVQYNLVYNGSAFTNDYQWHHFAGIFNGTNEFMYIDGVLVNSTSLGAMKTLRSDSSVLSIGSSIGGAFSINGSIDEVMIFNTALTADEILNINNTGRTTPYNGSTSGLVSYYSFNTGSAKDDYSTNHGTSINGTYETGVGESGLVGYWHGDNDANDYSGNGNDGVLINGALATGTGVYNSSFDFDGINDYVNITDSSSLNPTNTLTLAMWVNLHNITTNFGTFLMKGDGATTGQRAYEIRMNGATGKPQLLIGNATAISVQVSANTALTANTWQLITFTWDSTNARFYLNGVQDNSATSSGAVIANDIHPLRIGTGITDLTRTLNGSIDEVMIFNRTLSLQEIQDIYTRGRANWSYSAYQNVSTNNITYSLQNHSTTNILPDFNLVASSNNAFSPVIFGNLTFYASSENPVVYLKAPTNNSNTGTLENWFAGNATDNDNNKNATLYVWNSTGSVVITNTTSISGTYSAFNLSGTLPYGGTFTWNYYVCDVSDNCAWATNNWTIIFDIVAPTLQYVSPTENSGVTKAQVFIEMNATATDAGVGLKNITHFLYNSTFGLINSSNSLTSPFYEKFYNVANALYYYNTSACDNNHNCAWIATRNITLDTIAPNINYTAPTNDTTYTALVSGQVITAETINPSESVTWSYKVNAGAWQSGGTGTSMSQAYVFIAGSYNITVNATDSLGNSKLHIEYNVEYGSASGGSICGISAKATRNGTWVSIQGNSWDTSGNYASYTLSGTCKNTLGNSITFPTFTTYATGKYFSNFSILDGGTCELSAPSCAKTTIGWDPFTNSTISVSLTTVCNSTAGIKISSDNEVPYIKICEAKVFT